MQLEEQNEDVKMCEAELIQLFYNEAEKHEIGVATSESIDGYSATYANATAEKHEELTKKIANIVRTYLSNDKLKDGTPYLYCGVEYGN